MNTQDRAREMETGRFAGWPTSELAAQCRMQARENLDPEYSQFMIALADRLAALTPAEADVETVERVAGVLDNFENGFGYELRLTRLVDGEETHTLTYNDGSEPIDFSDRNDAYAHIQHRRSQDRARAVIASLAALPPRPADEPEAGPPCEGCGKPVRAGHVVVAYDDAGEVHVDCDHPYRLTDEPGSFILAGEPMTRVPVPHPLSRPADASKPDMVGDSVSWVEDGVAHHHSSVSRPSDDVAKLREALRTEIINAPETADFMAGVPIEAAHQRERWGANHDAGKTPEDWFWLIGYLGQKALRAQNAGDTDKALHHTISTAAALANWHAAIAGIDTSMRPGIDTPTAIRALSQDGGEKA